jgi:mRNA interferase HigB
LRIIALSTLRNYSRRRPDAASSLAAWHSVAADAEWRNSAAIKLTYGNASIINAERIVFNIGGNKHRLIVAADFRRSVLFIKFIGTHAEYDHVDAATVQHGDSP